ncbi:hypothetical protein J6590_004750 [Homalodisca vitripennis]|nr:hypothetical protein J6590_004750 [Homalodisca vitripennis]
MQACVVSLRVNCLTSVAAVTWNSCLVDTDDQFDSVIRDTDRPFDTSIPAIVYGQWEDDSCAMVLHGNGLPQGSSLGLVLFSNYLLSVILRLTDDILTYESNAQVVVDSSILPLTMVSVSSQYNNHLLHGDADTTAAQLSIPPAPPQLIWTPGSPDVGLLVSGLVANTDHKSEFAVCQGRGCGMGHR